MAVGTGFVEEEGEEINWRGRLNLFSFVEEDMIGELEKEKERKRREEEGEPEEDEDEDEEGGEGMDTEVEIKMKMKTATTDPKDMFDNFDKTKKSIFGKSSRTTKRLYKSYEKDYYEGPVTAVDTLVGGGGNTPALNNTVLCSVIPSSVTDIPFTRPSSCTATPTL